MSADSFQVVVHIQRNKIKNPITLKLYEDFEGINFKAKEKHRVKFSLNKHKFTFYNIQVFARRNWILLEVQIKIMTSMPSLAKIEKQHP